MIGCNFRFHEAIKKMKKLIDENQIGKPIFAKAENGTYLPSWHPYEDYRKSYAARIDLGGGVVLTCIHELDYLYWMFGKIREVTASTGKISDLDIKAEDYAGIIVKFKNNLIAEIHLDYFQIPVKRSCVVIGTKGKVMCDLETNVVQLYKNSSNKWYQKLKLKNYDINETYKKELKHFLYCVKIRKETINPLSHGIEILKIALSIKESSKQKKTIKL